MLFSLIISVSFWSGSLFRLRFMKCIFAVPSLTKLVIHWLTFDNVIQLLSAPQSSATGHDGKFGQITEKAGTAKYTLPKVHV